MTYIVRTRITGGFMFVLHYIDSFRKTRGVCNTKRFLCQFRQVIDCCLEDWYSAMVQRTVLSSIAHLKKVILLQIICLLLKKAFGQIQTRRIPFKNTSPAILRRNTRHFYLSISRHQRIRNSFFVSMPKI